jgi:transposase-like protein
MRFIREHQRGEESLASLCRRFGISRKTGYKWLQRFYADGGSLDDMADRSRRPHRHPTRTAARLEEAIVEARKQRSRWRPKKLRAWLVRHNPEVELPAVSTFAKIFRRHWPGGAATMAAADSASGRALRAARLRAVLRRIRPMYPVQHPET